MTDAIAGPARETLIGRILGKFGVKWLDFPAGATREEIDAVAAWSFSAMDVGQTAPAPTPAPVEAEPAPAAPAARSSSS